MDTYKAANKLLAEENAKLKEELQLTKEHLKKYTAPARSKTYYENNKEKMLEKMKSRSIPTDKRKEYNKQSYLRKKEKLQNENESKK